MNKLIEGEYFCINGNGYFVFTRNYHLNRGVCCGNGCLHCPFSYINVPEPKKTELLALNHDKEAF